jgi:transposase-like protein
MDKNFDFSPYYCSNENCENFSLKNNGNLSIRRRYGKDKSRILLYCRTCGTEFSENHDNALFGCQLPPDTIRQIIHHTAEGVSVRATARLLEIDKSTVNRIILKVGQHLSKVLSSALRSIHMTELQLDEMWSFVKKKKLLEAKTTKKSRKDESGSGQL